MFVLLLLVPQIQLEKCGGAHMNAAHTHTHWVVLEPRPWGTQIFYMDSKQIYPHSAPKEDTLFSKPLCCTIIHKKTVHNERKVSAFAHIYAEMQDFHGELSLSIHYFSLFDTLLFVYFFVSLLPSEHKLHESKDLLCPVLCSSLPSNTAFST